MTTASVFLDDVDTSDEDDDIGDIGVIFPELKVLLLDAAGSMISTHKKKFVNALREHSAKVKSRINKKGKSWGVRFRDKVGFVLGVVDLVLAIYLISSHQGDLVVTWFTTQTLVLLSLRYFFYKQQNTHYFLFDFCYFANLLLLLFLHIYPHSPTLFMVCFSYTIGPLTWATLAWRNSLVFHSLDKMTSCIIHLTPAWTVYMLRWYGGGRYTTCATPDCAITWSQAVFLPLIPYIAWQSAYLFKVKVVSDKKIKESKYTTSLGWMTASANKAAATYKLFNMFGPKFRTPMFVICQFLFTVLTMLPAKFCYESKLVHAMLLVFALLVCVWNGASFYIDIFSRRYIATLEAEGATLEKLISKVEQNIDKNGSN